MSGKRIMIVAPLSGTFYAAPSPESPPFVEEGQKVAVGEVLCIIESMKVFTELRSDYSGIVTKILLEDEDPVTRHQDLMEVEIE